VTSEVHILHLEDDPTDADLVQERLQSDGLASRTTRVTTEAEFLAALETEDHDLILADYTLPSFDGLAALNIAIEKRPDLPFIFLSGTLDETLAIETLKFGATDYVFKTRLERLLPSIQRALREGEERIKRRRTEAALQRSEAYLAEAQRLSHTGSFGWDLPTGNIYWSPETFRIMEFDPTTAPTIERVVERTHPEDRPVVQRVIEAAIREREGFDFEHRLLMADGAVKHVRVVAHPNGEEMVGAITDITESKKSHEALRASQSDLAHVTRLMTVGELAGSIAQGVNEPLCAIGANANTCIRALAGSVASLAEAREAAQQILRDVNRASEVMSRVLALTRRAVTEKQGLDLNGAIQEVLALTRAEMSRNGVALRTELPSDLPAVFGDRVQLQQLLMNLIVNGIEAMSSVTDRPRQLSITARNGEPDQVLVSVRDSGVGLDPQIGERIFEPFYSTKSGGIGMGLSISRSIALNHGGRLWAVANDGPGATFQFTLPKYKLGQ
jgi:C4-dicarboxylate-specific signal transduction histidine kinase